MLTIRLPPDIEARLEKLARRTGHSKSYLARQAVVAYFDDLEDIYLAELRYAALLAGKGSATSLEVVERSLGRTD